MDIDHYTYHVNWSPEDGAHVGLCVEFPSLSWLAGSPQDALAGIRKVVATVVNEMQGKGEEIPTPITVIKVVDLPEFDATLYLDSEMVIAAYLAAAQEDGDARHCPCSRKVTKTD